MLNFEEKMKRQNDFMAGFVAAQYSLKFSPASNEGDYSDIFWLGFTTARLLAGDNDFYPPSTLKGRYEALFENKWDKDGNEK